MKYSISIYAKALVAAIGGKGEGATVTKNFLALVRRNGDERYLSKIIGESERLMRRQQGVREIRVAMARKLKQPLRALLKNFAKPDDEIYSEVQPELIAGLKITVNDNLQFDGSMKGKIDKMFS